MKLKVNLIVFISILLAIFFLVEPCQAIDPFDNIPAPKGLYFLTYPFYYSSQKITDKNGEIGINNLGLHVYQNIFRFCYYNKTTFDNTWAFTILIPVGRIEILDDHDQGFGDFTIASAYWLIDSQASKTWLGAVAYVDIPLGNYDPTKSANTGSNVWKIRPSFVFAKQINQFDIELTFKYNFYTKNQDTNIRDGNEAIFESYLGYFLQPNLILGGHFNVTHGQDKVVDGSKISDTGIRRYQAGPSINWMHSNTFGITFETIFDFATRNSTEGQLFLLRFCWKIK
jgi:hypothetical protein